MSIVIGEFELVAPPEPRQGASDPASQASPAVPPSLTPEVLALIERHLVERALRVWAD